MGGIQSSLPRSFEKNSGKLKTDTLEDFQNIIKLLRQVPRQIDQIKILLEKGIVFQRSVLEFSHLHNEWKIHPLLICTWFFQKSSLKNQVRKTGFLVYFELDFLGYTGSTNQNQNSWLNLIF